MELQGYWCVHQSVSVAPDLSQINPFYFVLYCFFKIRLIFSFRKRKYRFSVNRNYVCVSFIACYRPLWKPVTSQLKIHKEIQYKYNPIE